MSIAIVAGAVILQYWGYETTLAIRKLFSGGRYNGAHNAGRRQHERAAANANGAARRKWELRN